MSAFGFLDLPFPHARTLPVSRTCQPPEVPVGSQVYPPSSSLSFPLSPLQAPKKLIRYLDNQVVSTRGERYKDTKKPESEEMKRTYINLKPARKYKFH